MASTDSPAYPDNEIEGLIAALTGVLAARVVSNPLGRIEEIHVLADEQLHPKQMVRNIESALSAGLGVTVDRRVVSIAQVRGDPEVYDDVASASNAPTPAAPPPPDDAVTRYIFVGYDARTQPDLEAACRVTIRRGNEVISGTGSGPSTPLGRAQAAARAVFAAIAAARRDHTLGLEGVTLVESHGRSYIMVAAHAIHGRETLPLTGIGALNRSPEEAAILASLQATNRWAELGG
ncbi:MAG TPA: hypothetical protein VMN60_01860 [Longimicrobiales bacterium]|nr:hypothetical protein [Longimicrobiales bacterium]